MAKLNDNKKLLSSILTEMFEEVLDVRNNSAETIVNEERFLKAIPIPSVNGVDSADIENNLTEANKETMLKIMDECYRHGDYGKFMRFLTYAFPISYSSNETITTMYNSLRKQLGKSEYDELSYEDLRKLFSTGKPLEKLVYDSATLFKQFVKKSRKQVLTDTDILRFIIKGYQVADFYESHTAEMEHFRELQNHFYHRNKGEYSNVDVEMLNELEANGYNDILLLRQMFDKGGSKNSENNKLYTRDVSSPSSALDSIEMRNVVEADEVIRSMFISKYVKEALSSGKNYDPSFYKLNKSDKELFTDFMVLEGEGIDSILMNDVKMYAKNIKALVDKLFKNKQDIVMFKPYLAKTGEDGWVSEPYSEKELKAQKQTLINAIVDSAIRHGAFTTSSKEDFMNRIAIACTDKLVTKHFNHSALNGFEMDENGNPIDFESSFPDAANAPFADQQRKCACATINYDGKLYFVTNIPAIPAGKSDNVADDEWILSITDQELKALIVKLSNIYGVSFCDLTRENIIVEKNIASVEASRMALGSKGKVNIETAFEITKKYNVQRENDNPYIQKEDLVADLSAFENSPFYQQAYNKEREKYAHMEGIASVIKMASSLISSMQEDYQDIYADRRANLEGNFKYNSEKRDETLEEQAHLSQQEYDAQEHKVDDSAWVKYTQKLTPEEVNRAVKEPVVQSEENVSVVETEDKQTTEIERPQTPIIKSQDRVTQTLSICNSSTIVVEKNNRRRVYSVSGDQIIDLLTDKPVSNRKAKELFELAGKTMLKNQESSSEMPDNSEKVVSIVNTADEPQKITTEKTQTTVEKKTTITQTTTPTPSKTFSCDNPREEIIKYD